MITFCQVGAGKHSSFRKYSSQPQHTVSCNSYPDFFSLRSFFLDGLCFLLEKEEFVFFYFFSKSFVSIFFLFNFVLRYIFFLFCLRNFKTLTGDAFSLSLPKSTTVLELKEAVHQIREVPLTCMK